MMRKIACFDISDQRDTSTTSHSESIIEIIHQFIQDERRRSFCFLAKHSHRYMNQKELLTVCKATAEQTNTLRSRDHCSLLAAFVDSDWYTFDEPAYYNAMRRTVALTVPAGRDVAIENMNVVIPVLDGSLRTTPAAAWLRETYNWDDDWVMKFSAIQYEEQQKWWDGTSKVFRFFDLPLELREAIYLEAIGPVVVLDTHDSRVVLGKGLSYGSAKRPSRNRDHDIEKPNMIIMRINKQVRAEATLVANRDTFKRLRMVRHAGPPNTLTSPTVRLPTIIATLRSHTSHPDFLRNFQLEMSAVYYFASIGIYPRPGDAFALQQGQFHLSTLKHFPSLQRLDLSFLSPKHPDAACPWTLANRDAHSCQKIWIDWFFTLAWDVLQLLRGAGHLRFSLSGCVKASSKTYWERVLNDHREDTALEIKAAQRRVREEKKDMGCVPCVCSVPCSRREAGRLKTYVWDEEDVRLIEGLREHIEDEYWCFRD